VSGERAVDVREYDDDDDDDDDDDAATTRTIPGVSCEGLSMSSQSSGSTSLPIASILFRICRSFTGVTCLHTKTNREEYKKLRNL
jgi:hypothetical protein